MVATSLQDDLLSIPGVEGAEVEGLQDAPAGLRIRIAEGADQEAVGGAIRRVLSSYGLGTDTRLPGEADPVTSPLPSLDSHSEEEVSTVAVLAPEVDASRDPDDVEESIEVPEPQDSAVIDLTDRGSGILDSDEDPEDDLVDPSTAFVAPSVVDRTDPPPFVVPRAADDEAEKDEPVASVELSDSIARIESVAVVEGRAGVVVTVTASSGDDVSHMASSSEGGVEAAVVIAASTLVDPAAPDPIVVEIEDRRVEGVDIVMIVLDVDGHIAVGSAVVEAGRAFALGRATWAALAL